MASAPPAGAVLGAVATVTSPVRDARTKPPPRARPAAPEPAEVAAPTPSGPRGRSDGALGRAQAVAADAITAGTGNAMLAPLFFLAVGLLALAALAPALAGHRWRPVIDRRGHVAVAGLAFLAAWIVVVGVGS